MENTVTLKTREEMASRIPVSGNSNSKLIEWEEGEGKNTQVGATDINIHDDNRNSLN